MADILSQEELDALLTQMRPEDDADDSAEAGPGESSDSERAASNEAGAAPGPAAPRGINEENLQMILNIPLDVRVEIGRARMLIGEILELCQGSVIELDHLASDMIDLTINDKVLAKGEAVVVNENFGLRVLEVDSVGERIRKL